MAARRRIGSFRKNIRKMCQKSAERSAAKIHPWWTLISSILKISWAKSKPKPEVDIFFFPNCMNSKPEF